MCFREPLEKLMHLVARRREKRRRKRVTHGRVTLLDWAWQSSATLLYSHPVVRHRQSMNVARKDDVEKPVGWLIEPGLLHHVLYRIEVRGLAVKKPLLVPQCLKVLVSF